MTPLRASLMLAPLAAVAALTVPACQRDPELVPKVLVVDNQPIEIVGVSRPPKVMLVVDRSDTMKEGLADAAKTCTVAPANDPRLPYDPASPNGCKWSIVRDAIAGDLGLLAGIGQSTRMALAILPGAGVASDECAPGQVQIPLADEPGANVEALKTQLRTEVTPGGRSPLYSALEAVRADASFMSTATATKRLIILVTDGLPDCNPDNALRCQACDAAGTLEACSGPGNCHPAGASSLECKEPLACSDAERAIAAVRALRDLGVQTLVFGVHGTARNPSATAILNALADAGGMPKDDAAIRYHDEQDLEELKDLFRPGRALWLGCSFRLSRMPLSPEIMQITLVDAKQGDQETTLERGVDWALSDDVLTILGPRCAQLMSAEPDQYRMYFLYPSAL